MMSDNRYDPSNDLAYLIRCSDPCGVALDECSVYYSKVAVGINIGAHELILIIGHVYLSGISLYESSVYVVYLAVTVGVTEHIRFGVCREAAYR